MVARPVQAREVDALDRESGIADEFCEDIERLLIHERIEVRRITPIIVVAVLQYTHRWTQYLEHQRPARSCRPAKRLKPAI